MVRVSAYPNRVPKYERHSMLEDDVPLPIDQHDVLQTENRDEQANAMLDLVIIPRDDAEMIKMSKSNFLRVYDSFNIDPYTLNYISDNWYGFYSPSAMYNGVYTFFIGTVLYVLAFSFNPGTMTTSAILLPRTSNGFGTGSSATKEFEAILSQYIDRIYSPVILVFVAFIHLQQWLDKSIYVQLTTLRGVEYESGYGPYGGKSKGLTSKGVKLDTLTQLSSKVGSMLVTLANTTRHQEIAASLAEFLGNSASPAASTYDIAEGLREMCNRSQAGFEHVLACIKQQLKGGSSTTKYLQDRTQSQSSVVRRGYLRHGVQY